MKFRVFGKEAADEDMFANIDVEAAWRWADSDEAKENYPLKESWLVSVTDPDDVMDCVPRTIAVKFGGQPRPLGPCA